VCPRLRGGESAPQYRSYDDHEWGLPVADDVRLFEKLSLEGFQAGLSWLTIRHKREAFRSAFAGFDPRPRGALSRPRRSADCWATRR
jgi:DNA-3-methyladenine glycosylase I